MVRDTRGEQVLDTLIKEGSKPVAVVPMMFVSGSHGYVPARHGDDFFSSGSSAALDEVDRALTAHFDIKDVATHWTDGVWWRGD